MRATKFRPRGERRVSLNEHARMEIQAFLQALDSYPRTFAKDPAVTFEAHRSTLVALTANQPHRQSGAKRA
jgi:hypothetical protein